MNHEKITTHFQRALALIDTPEKWTKGANERDSYGNDLENSEHSETKVASYCAVGAIVAAYEPTWDVTPYRLLRYLLKAIEHHTDQIPISVATWNDNSIRTHAEVLEAFEWAIADQFDFMEAATT